MASTREKQRIIRAYKDETGDLELDMRKVATWAASKGWPLPKPPTAIDILTKQFSDAARVETRRDPKTGRPYRANHSIVTTQGGTQLHLWIDIDEAKRGPMLKSLVNRREQMVGDGLQLSLDIEHWNSVNPAEEPIDLPMDLTFDIELRKNAPDEDDKEAA